MHPEPIIELGPFKVYLYGLMIAIGLLVCVGYVFLYAKKKNMEKGFADYVESVGIGGILIGFFSATLFQSVYNYLDNPSAGFEFGGMTFLGGLIGGAVSFISLYFLCSKKYRHLFIHVLDLAPCSITVAHAFGRLGCFFAGCCYGKLTSSWLGVDFPGLGHRYPTQLFESAFLFILCGTMIFLSLKKKFRYTMPMYLVCYGIWRFCLEFIRGDERGKFIGPFSPSQMISMIMIVLAIPVFFLEKKLWSIRDLELAHEVSDQIDASSKEESEESETK